MADFNQYYSNLHCSIYCLCYTLIDCYSGFVMTRKCKNNPNLFCYICSSLTTKGKQRSITSDIKIQKDLQVVLWLPTMRPRQEVGTSSDMDSLFCWFTQLTPQTNVIDAFYCYHDMARTKRLHSGLLFLPCQCERVLFKM